MGSSSSGISSSMSRPWGTPPTPGLSVLGGATAPPPAGAVGGGVVRAGGGARPRQVQR
eukprot:CAMPEP_0194567644 /NCGR_PEP_ID=MMETSP0292-20121207/6032_1 /TAXON_ID=39354 /ORGANISM="Heterosigma akashiwo, Strain CCMP2393" /LENGTH=57 /DNA_ID=CAMNT_0039417445 /DNA_START=288 /DNA_END=458 /DNA_ORIENTATION=+